MTIRNEIRSLDMNVLLEGNGRKIPEKPKLKTNSDSDFVLYEKPQAQNKTASAGSAYLAPRDAAKQSISNSMARSAGVAENVFDKIGRDYVESREKESVNFWEGFSDFFAKEESNTSQKQADKFSLGSDNKTAEEARQNSHNDLARKYGVEQNLIDEIETKAAPKKGKDIFTESVESGVWNIGADLIWGVDFVFGQKDGMLSKASDFMQKKAAEKYEDAIAAAERTEKGKSARNTAETIIGITEIVPEMLLAAATGGTSKVVSAAGKGGKMLNGLKNIMKEAVKNPVFWYSFETGLNQEYEKAIENGATDSEAKTSAVLSAAINAVIETGDGKAKLSSFFGTKKGKGKHFLDWAESSFREGFGEVSQDAISEITQEMIYGGGGKEVNLSDLREKLVIDLIISGALKLPSALNRAIADGFDVNYFKYKTEKGQKNIIQKVENIKEDDIIKYEDKEKIALISNIIKDLYNQKKP